MMNGREPNRILFLDNLRYLMVLLVLVLHAAIPYSNFVPWWCVKVPNAQAVFFDVVILILDVFLMPVLFFIAGYFAILSFQKKGLRVFLRRKFKRLGLPLLIAIPIVSPTFSYIHHVTRNGFSAHLNFGIYWVNYMKTIADLPLGIMTSIDQFSQSHLWFMSLLLIFFVVFASFARTKIKNEGPERIESPKKASPGSIIIVLAVVGFLSAVFATTGTLLFASALNPEPWLTILNLLQFQPDSEGSYILFFGVGVFAYTKKWFAGTEIPGHLVLWVLSCAVLSVGLLLTLNQVIRNFSIEIFLVYLVIKSFLCVSFLAAFSKWAALHWNRPSKLNASLAVNSYHIYITHFLIVILFQLLMAGWSAGSVFIQFGVVSLGSILLSYTVSNFCLRPYPRWSVVGIYALFIIMLIPIGSAGF